MTVQAFKPNTRASQATAHAIRHHPFSVYDYHRMRTVGILQEDDRVELLDGEIYTTSPIGPSHAAIVNRLLKWLSQQISDNYILSVQSPIQLSDISEPQPDLAILYARSDFYANAHPTAADVVLLIEVADTSLEYDRVQKLPRYARAGISEVWLVDVAQRHIEQHTRPAGKSFLDKRKWTHEETLVAAAEPPVQINLNQLFSGS